MRKSPLPPGFRFSPTDVELVQYYLKRKVMGKRLHFNFIAEVDIHKYAPWDLPEKSCWQGDLKWYFFCPTSRKYPTGARVKRANECGYWKATGKDRSVLYNGEVSGWIKTLIFHRGRAPKGERTDWVMHEYRLEAKNLADSDVLQDSYVICMIFQKDGPGPRNGAEYGAPFKEEDWTDDEAEICSEAVPHANMPEPNLVVPSNYNSSIITSTHSPEGIHELGNVIPSGNACATPHVNSDDIYEDLGDLGKLARVSEDGYNFSTVHNSVCAPAQMLLGDNEQFLELDDLGRSVELP